MRVFDVNLRAPFYSGEVIQESLELATVMKMNEAEVPLVLGLLGLPVGRSARKRAACDSSICARAERLLDEFPALRDGGRDARQPAAACWSRATSGTSTPGFP